MKFAPKSALFFAVLAVLTLGSQSVVADEVFRIEVGKNYDSYSNTDLKRRVWELERAVSQLQAQVFHLAMNNNIQPQIQPNPWTCRITSFMKNYDETRPTKAAAMAAVIKKCSEGSHAMHCKDEDVKCGNE